MSKCLSLEYEIEFWTQKKVTQGIWMVGENSEVVSGSEFLHRQNRVSKNMIMVKRLISIVLLLKTFSL